MMMPSIALPTGPYDWHPERIPRNVYDERLEIVQSAMADRRLTHAVVHGNVLDDGALGWLTHFTPKLGPAYALIPASGPLRLLFAGGPGMKPSAQRLTWVEDVVALKGVEGDVRCWLDETACGAPVRLGLVEGRAMLRGDWRAVQRVAGGEAIELDTAMDAARAQSSSIEAALIGRAEEILKAAADAIATRARLGTDLRAAALDMERAAYAAGAQDVRVKIARCAMGPPTAMPDGHLPMLGPTPIALAVRYAGYWAEARLVLG